jgi:ABC-2 type transport system permease protein
MQGAHIMMTVFRRELKSYFESPVAYVFMIVMLVLTGFLTFFSFTRYFDRGIADMQSFFFWIPWVFLVLVPASTMGLWAEERRTGTIELLLTMPITLFQAILGKFLAAWTFMTIGLALTFPMIVTTCYLGNPDMGPIWGAYAGSVLMLGAYVAVGMLMSSMTRSQVIGFVLSALTCLLFALAGFSPVTTMFDKWAPSWVVDAVAAVGFMSHFDSLQRGVIDIGDIAYFLTVMVFMICGTHVVLDNRKSS